MKTNRCFEYNSVAVKAPVRPSQGVTVPDSKCDNVSNTSLRGTKQSHANAFLQLARREFASSYLLPMTSFLNIVKLNSLLQNSFHQSLMPVRPSQGVTIPDSKCDSESNTSRAVRSL